MRLGSGKAVEVGMDGKKKAAAEESPNLKVGALIYATVVAAFPFWVRELMSNIK